MAKRSAEKPESKPAPKSAPKPARAGGAKGVKEVRGDPRPEGLAAGAAPVPMRAILGQSTAIEVLQSSMRSGRVHHAWIFHGPAGVGKFTTALSFAATLLDPSSAAGLDGFIEPDEGSPVQGLLRAGSHPDLHVVTKELARFSDERSVRESKLITIPKDVIERHLLAPAALAPTMRGGGLAGKVFIVDEAELLDRSPTNAPTQNAILKTLEEPPPGTVIILVTSGEDRLLPTIRSRCQRVPFAALDEKSMQAWLKSSSLDLSSAEKAWLVAFAGGSPGALRDAHAAGMHGWHSRVEPMLKTMSAGKFVVELGATLSELADGYAKAWVEAHPNASKDAANKDGADRVLRVVAGHYRAAARAAARSERTRAELLASLSAIDRVRECERHIDANVNLALAMGNLAAQLSELGAG